MNNNIIDQTITISSTEINNLSISDSQSPDNKCYNKNDKKILASRIEQIKSKKIYLKLFKIISDDGNHYVINPNGVLFNLNNVSDITLAKIERILDLCDEYMKKTKKNQKWSDLLEKTCENVNDKNDKNDKNDDNLNNHEKMILNRQRNLNDKNLVYWGSNISSFNQI